ncbi:hypothetical protein N4R57_10205 [Rhodobacteraceae bacterium D3-12]|nr:hypothetical protein N4R57_10205 [Rhodobacteraceae bacterium D3-12]
MSHVSREDLDRAIPEILAAPKSGAAIEMLCLRPRRNAREFVDQIEVTQAEGIPGERWLHEPWLKLEDGRPHPGIQVCVLQKRVLDLIWRDRENTPHPGDTFIVDMDLSEENLPVGQLLSAGSAVLRVSDVFNEACVKWKVRYGAAAKEWVTAPGHPKLRLRGLLCSVEKDGTIQNGDVLRKID